MTLIVDLEQSAYGWKITDVKKTMDNSTPLRIDKRKPCQI